MNSSYKKWLLASLAAGALSASINGQAFAQSESTGGLEEVVVTARKTNENLVVVPLSVTALSATDLTNRGISNYVGLQDYTPGFKFINQSVNRNDRGYASFIMRGMNPGTPVSYQQGVSVFLDGAPIAGGVVSGLADVERVEVIKGPQSAYFGRSTFSGAVNFITREPGFYPKAQIDASYASYNTYDVSGEVEGPIFRDVLAGRIAGRVFHTDGQYSNPNRLSLGQNLGEQDTYSVSGELTFKPTDKLKVRVFGKYWKDDDGPAATPYIYPSQYNCNATQPGFTITGLQFVNGKNFVCGDLPNFTQASLSLNTQIPASIANVLDARAPALISGVYRTANLAKRDFDMTALGLKRTGYAVRTIIHYDLPAGFSLDANAAADSNHWAFLADTTTKDMTLTPNPNFGSTAAAFNAINTPGLVPYTQTWVVGGNNDDDISAEMRITSPQDKRLKGMLGASYFRQHSLAGTVLYSNAGYAQITPLQANNASTPAVFGSVTYDILDNLDLSVEGREQWDTIANIIYATNTRFEKTYKSFSPRAILSYHPTPSSTIYASYSEGTRPGSFNGFYNSLLPAYQAQVRAQSPVELSVPEQKVKMSEVGFKSRFLDNRAQVLTAIYYGDWTGRTIPNKVYYVDVSGVLQNTLFNVAGGHTELYGVEAEGRFQVTPEFLLEGTFNYAGTNIKTTYCGDCALITGNPNPTGTTMTGYPTYSGSLAGTYSRPAFADFEGFLRLEYIYTGNIWVDEANIAGTGSANKINVRAGLNNGRYRIEAFGTNITNDKTYIYGQRYSDGLPQAGSGLTNVPVNEISVSAPEKAVYGLKITATFGGNPPPPPPPPPAPPPPPPPQPPPPPPPVAYEAREFVVYFPFDQYVLTPEAQQVIAQAADYAKGGNATRVVVVGHADTSGSAAYNVRLSERRAKATADALVGSGLAQTALAVDWKGESMPAVATGDGVKEPFNRRATININF